MFECKCGEEFKNKGALGSHKRFCEFSDIQVNNEYLCECGESFKHKGALNSHRSYCNVSEKEKSTWKIEKIKCPKCDKKIAKSQIDNHLGSSKCVDYSDENGEFICEYCENKHDGSYGSGRFCSESCAMARPQNAEFLREVNKKYWSKKENRKEQSKKMKKIIEEDENDIFKTVWEKVRRGYKTGRLKAWQEGLSKEEDERIAKQAESVSETITEKVKNNEWHSNRKKSDYYQYKDIKFHSSWEVKYAKYLDKNNIEWKRPDTSFKYKYKNDLKKYIPDFYLINEEKYIEIKGFETEKDRAKWEDFPEELEVLKESDLNKLDIL